MLKRTAKPENAQPAAKRKLTRAERKQIEAIMDRIQYKISKYEEAVKTGKLVWDGKITDGECTM